MADKPAESMIEPVARAICLAHGHEPDADWRIGEQVTLEIALKPGKEQCWRTHARQAHAAIKAMRKPTEEMLNCAVNAGWHNGIEGLPDDEKDAGEDLWQAMIDKALEG